MITVLHGGSPSTPGILDPLNPFFFHKGVNLGYLNKWMFVLLVFLLAVGLTSAGEGSDPGEKPSAGVVTPRDKFYDVAFVGKDNVWIVGYPGKILHSPDGGKTWELQPGGVDEALFAVSFVDTFTGWIVGRSGIVLHTENGGDTWQTQNSGIKEPLFDVYFVDKKEGWAVGYFGTIIHTQDGGKSWRRQQIEGDASLNGVSFVGRQEGWIAGESGYILHTADGGENWVNQESGVKSTLFDISFIDKMNGWAVGSKGAILQTEDGGKSWEAEESGVEDHLLGIFFRGDKLWLVGMNGTVLKGKGEGYKHYSLGVSWLSGIGFGDPEAGLIVGGRGNILRTEDGGDTWEILFGTTKIIVDK